MLKADLKGTINIGYTREIERQAGRRRDSRLLARGDLSSAVSDSCPANSCDCVCKLRHRNTVWQ